MNRVTYWNDEYGCWSYHCSSGDAAKLLAAYEDTGLEPEEVLTAKENAEVACALNLLKEYQSVGSVEHFRELSQTEHDGRLVVLPEVSERDRKSFIDGLQDYFQEASFCDPSTGVFGMSEGEKEIAAALMNALTREEAEAALSEKGEKHGKQS